MNLLQRHRPNHALLLIPVRLRSERLPYNKVKILACDAEGKLFTQTISKSTYRRINEMTQQNAVSFKNFATIYWDTSTSRSIPLFVEVSKSEIQALERILEHALRSTMIPDILKRYPKDIIKKAEKTHQEQLIKNIGQKSLEDPSSSSKILNRLPYYRGPDTELSIPIYKARLRFPLIILKKLTQAQDTPSGKQRCLILDSDGDIATITLPSDQVNTGNKKLVKMKKTDKRGYLICLDNLNGMSVDIMEISELQKQALENLTQRFEKTAKGKLVLSATVKGLLHEALEIHIK